MSEVIMRNMDDLPRLLGILQARGFDKPVKVTIKDLDRSGEQNKKLHAALGDIARQVEYAGKKWDILIWKRLLTAAWMREEGENPMMIPAVDGSGVDIVYEKTSKLTVKQCASLLEWVAAYGAENNVRWSQKDLWEGRY